MQCERCGQTHPRCAGHKRSTGEPCGNWPIRGSDKCRMHAGKKAAASIGQHVAEQAVTTYGLPADVDPHDALLEEVHRTAGHVRWLGRIVAELQQGDLVWGVTKDGVERGDIVSLSEAAPNVWLTLYHRERVHLVKVAKTAVDAGIDERRVRIAEQQGEIIVQVLRATLTDLGVDVTPEVAATVGKHLRLVEGGKAA